MFTELHYIEIPHRDSGILPRSTCRVEHPTIQSLTDHLVSIPRHLIVGISAHAAETLKKVLEKWIVNPPRAYARGVNARGFQTA